VEPVEQKRLLASSSVEAADFDVWVERYQRLVRWRLARWVPRQDVDDLALDVFRAWHRSLETGAGATATFGRGSRGRKRVQAWLLGQARERARQHVRALQGSDSGRIDYRRWRSRRRRSMPPVDALSTHRLKRAYRHYRQRGVAAGAVGAGAADAAWQAAALRCLASLPLRYREILEAYYLRARSAQNIAVQRQRTPASVRQILLRVRRLVSRAVAQLPPPETALHGDLVLAALPAPRWGQLSDSQFVAACLAASLAEAAAVVVVESTSSGPPPLESETASGVVELPGAPPVAVEPPPRVWSPGLAGESRGRRSKWLGPWALVGLTGGVGLVIVLGVLLSFFGQNTTPGMAEAAGGGEPKGAQRVGEPQASGAGAFGAGALGAGAPGAGVLAATDNGRVAAAGKAVAVAPGPDFGAEPPWEPVLEDPFKRAGEPPQDQDQDLAADPANLIKDFGPAAAGPQITEFGWGRLITSPDAQWQVDPRAALGRDSATWEREGIELRLTQGQASLELAEGWSVRFQGPVQLRVRRAAGGRRAGAGAGSGMSVEFELLDGWFQVQVPEGAAAPAELRLAAEATAQVSVGSDVWLQASPDFGTSMEVLSGQLRMVMGRKPWEVVELQADDHYLAQVLPASFGDRATPVAVAVVRQNGDFMGRLMHDQEPLHTSRPEIFARVFQVLLRRLREAPEQIDQDWRSVVEKLGVVARADRGNDQVPETLYSGDRLPEHPELQRLLMRGLASPQGVPGQMVRLGNAFGGRVVVNGREFDLGDAEKVNRARQELEVEVNQARNARVNQRRNRPGRLNPADPDAMVEQMLEHQMRQMEVMADLVNQFAGDAAVVGLAEALPGGGEDPAMSLDPVVHSFNQLTAATGKQDRAAVREHVLRALNIGLEDEQQRAERLEAMRRKLHER